MDVTRGSNDLDASSVPGYDAVAGYDLASGLGTIDAGRFVPALVAATKGRTQPLAGVGAAPDPASTMVSRTPSRSPSASSPAPHELGASRAAPDNSPSTGVAVLIGVVVALLAGGLGFALLRRGRSH